MTKTIEDLFYWNLFITDLILIFLFIRLFFKGNKPNATWFILGYTLTNLSINTIVEFFPFKGMYVLYSFFTFIEYAFFTAFIYSFIDKKGFKRIILILSALFALFLPIYYKTTTQASIDSIPIGIETLFILLFAFYYFYEQMNDLNSHYLYNRYHFWMIIGMMLYLAGSFFIYIFANHVDERTQGQFWFLTYFFYVVRNLFFIIGITYYSKKANSPSLKDLYPYLN